jgi:hypothetical protein
MFGLLTSDIMCMLQCRGQSSCPTPSCKACAARMHKCHPLAALIVPCKSSLTVFNSLLKVYIIHSESHFGNTARFIRWWLANVLLKPCSCTLQAQKEDALRSPKQLIRKQSLFVLLQPDLMPQQCTRFHAHHLSALVLAVKVTASRNGCSCQSNAGGCHQFP